MSGESMRSGEHGLRALWVLTLAAFGVMGLGAVGVQAQLPAESTPGLFLINSGSALLALVGAQQTGERKLLVKGRGMEIKCDATLIEEEKIVTSTDASLKATFQGCKTYEHGGKVIENCILKGGSIADGGVIVAKALVIPTLHGEETFLLFQPVEGSTLFTTVSYEANKGCVLPLNNPVKGAFTALIIAKESQMLLFVDEAVQLLTGDILQFGVFPSYIDAEATAELIGEHQDDELDIHSWSHSEILHLEELHHNAHLAELHLEELHQEAHLAELHLEELHEKNHLEELDSTPLESTGTSSPGKILINLGSALLAAITGMQIGSGKLLIEGRGIEIGCDTAHVSEGKITSSSDASAKVEFLGCKTYEFGKLVQIENCILKGGTIAGGGIIIVKFLILPIVHNGQSFLLFEPSEGTTLTTFSYEANKGCSMPLNNPIAGAFSARFHEGVISTLLLSKSVQLLTADKANYAVFPLYIDAEGRLELVGEHAGYKLGVASS
jgi:hypothetical protein